MKKKYEVYAIDSKVYAMSRYYDDGAETDHVAIYPAIVKDVSISKDAESNSIKFEYWLVTPEGKEWGDVVNGDEVSDTFDVLTNKLKKEWHRNANTH